MTGHRARPAALVDLSAVTDCDHEDEHHVVVDLYTIR